MANGRFGEAGNGTIELLATGEASEGTLLVNASLHA